MSLPLDILTSLLLTCAPMVAPETGIKVVRHESGGNPFAIGVNGPYVVKPQPNSQEQATATAKALLRMPGVRSIDIGLGMINSNNLRKLNLTIDQAFDPCTNLGAMQHVLLTSYQKWVKVHGQGEPALQKTLSEYNTGHPSRGLSNGYVYKVYMQPIR